MSVPAKAFKWARLFHECRADRIYQRGHECGDSSRDGAEPKRPGGFITIGPSGVAISGTMVLINSGGAAGSGSPGQTPSLQIQPLPTRRTTAPRAGDVGFGPGLGQCFYCRARIESTMPLQRARNSSRLSRWLGGPPTTPVVERWRGSAASMATVPRPPSAGWHRTAEFRSPHGSLRSPARPVLPLPRPLVQDLKLQLEHLASLPNPLFHPLDDVHLLRNLEHVSLQAQRGPVLGMINTAARSSWLRNACSSTRSPC